MNDSCILVFTSRDIEAMILEGGSFAWALEVGRARSCRYLVCAWNPRGEFATGRSARDHGEGFLVAPITAIEAAVPPHDPKRSIICFTEYSEIQIPNLWSGQRNPVQYTTLRSLGIDPDELTFQSRAHDDVPSARALSQATPSARMPFSLTLAEAKKGLAAHYGVIPECIEILIRG